MYNRQRNRRKGNIGRFDDLLVGAPYWWSTDPESKAESGGAVYVYFASGGFKDVAEAVFQEPVRLTGPSKHGHFGLAIAALVRCAIRTSSLTSPHPKFGTPICVLLNVLLSRET